MSSGGSWADPRRLGFHVLSVLAVLVCVVAARWQWDRANRTEADAVPEGPVVALADLDPATAFSGMRVGITGVFDPEHEVLIAPRPRAGTDGAWVLTPMQPTAVDGTGTPDAGTSADPADTSVAVVRGWVPAGQRATPPPEGVVAVVGVLVADARQPDAAVTPGDPPTLAVVDTGALAEHAGYPVRSGWFALTDLQPAGEAQPVALQVTELPGAEVGLNWRNAAYAVQWIGFAGFAIFFWNRFRRDYVDRPVEQETPQ
jgi:cytochrome oxidase assembly protein ShyY1